MRGRLGWREKPVTSGRPRVTIHREGIGGPDTYQYSDGKVNDFLYGDTPNPFHPEIRIKGVGRRRAHPRFECPGGDFWN